MPRVDPERSFEVSARHLFRHINDAEALRANPLLRRHFATDMEADPSLKKAQADIVRLAEALCQELADKGLALQAVRRRAIVTALCAKEPVNTTAARLRISRSQYYRERGAICGDIARALMRATPTHDARLVARQDALRLLFRRAESLRDAGRSSEAVKVLENAYGCIAERFTKSAVGLGLAEELVFLGQHDRARELLARDRELSAEDVASGATEWLRDSRTLNVARLESQLNRGADATSALEMFGKRRIAERRSDDVSFTAVFLAGESYRNAGRYAEARTMLRHLRTMDPKLLRGSPKRQIAICLLAAYCSEKGGDELGLAEQSLRDALELAISNGTLVGALLAMAGLIEYEAARGRDGAAYVMAHEALRMVNGVDFNGFLGYVVVQIVGALLKTRYWLAADPLIFEIERLAAPRSLGRALLKHAQGGFFMRTGRQERARELLLEGLAAARQIGNRRIEGLILRDFALALAGPNAGREGSHLMREAVELVERYGTNDDLSTTYDAAARVIGDPRSVRLARQARMLSNSRSLEATSMRDRDPIRVEPLRLQCEPIT